MKSNIYYRLMGKINPIGIKWDKLSPFEEEAINFAHTYINLEPEKKVNGEYSLEYCLAHSGETINARYRHDNLYEIDRKIANMVARQTTKKAFVVYRGVCRDVWEQMIINAKMSEV